MIMANFYNFWIGPAGLRLVGLRLVGLRLSACACGPSSSGRRNP